MHTHALHSHAHSCMHHQGGEAPQDGAFTASCRVDVHHAAQRGEASRESGQGFHMLDLVVPLGLSSSVYYCIIRFPTLQAGEYVEASKAAVKVEGHNKVVTTLLVANSYEQDDLVGEGKEEGGGRASSRWIGKDL